MPNDKNGHGKHNCQNLPVKSAKGMTWSDVLNCAMSMFYSMRTMMQRIDHQIRRQFGNVALKATGYQSMVYGCTEGSTMDLSSLLTHMYGSLMYHTLMLHNVLARLLHFNSPCLEDLLSVCEWQEADFCSHAKSAQLHAVQLCMYSYYRVKRTAFRTLNAIPYHTVTSWYINFVKIGFIKHIR